MRTKYALRIVTIILTQGILLIDGHVIFAEPGEYFSGSFKAHPAVVKMQHLICLSPHIPAQPNKEAVEKSWSVAPLIVDMLKDASHSEGQALFSNVESKSFSLALGAWPTGTYQYLFCINHKN